MVDTASTPSIEDQRRFVLAYFKATGASVVPNLEEMLSGASKNELKDLVIDGVNGIMEVLKGDYSAANELMARNGLPEFSKFRLLNKKMINSILRKDAIKKPEDAMFLRDAIEAGLIPTNQLEAAKLLIKDWV